VPSPPRKRVSFDVFGTPVPQGSKRVWMNAQSKQAMMTEDAGARLYTWRMEVMGQARQAMSDIGRFGEPFREPISCLVTFRYHRPQSHYGTGRNAEVLKPSAPPLPAKPPDLDKLVRAIWDACTSVVWVDDGQVVAATIRKGYVDRWIPEGVSVVIGTFDNGRTDDGLE
jgi:Holliday junction resolvase RusA-like endonuclease